MFVIVNNTPVELPDLEAQILLRRGIARLPERADLPTETRYESSGTAMLPSSAPATVRNRASRPKAHQRRSRSSDPCHVRTRRSFVKLEWDQDVSTWDGTVFR